MYGSTAHSAGANGSGGASGGEDGHGGHERLAFFRAVLGERLPDGLWAHVWQPTGKHTDWVRDVEAAERAATRNGRHDVYLGIGLAGVKGAPTERVRANTAAGLLGVLADIDIAGDGHKHAALPPDEAAALALLGELGLPPTITVHSGHGIHAWWLFKEPWRFRDDFDRQYAMKLLRGWQQYVNSVAANLWLEARLRRRPGTRVSCGRYAEREDSQPRHTRPAPPLYTGCPLHAG